MENKFEFSMEFFPPKTEKMHNTLWKTITKLEPLHPEFVSVTYGAGGSTRKRTHETINKILYSTSLKPVPHLTCIGDTKESIKEIAKKYWESGIRSMVTLRGDPENLDLSKTKKFILHPNGYKYASELILDLKSVADFEITVAAFPEKHPESKNFDEDIDNLKRKIDAGASKAITQFFFDNNKFYDFINLLKKKKINIPVVPGILPILNYDKLIKFAKSCSATIPNKIKEILEKNKNNKNNNINLAAEIAINQCDDLIQNGVDKLHFYTLNQASLTFKICSNIQKK